MTRKNAKELLPIIQAFAEGKTIQYYDSLIDIADWEDCENPNFENLTYKFRIKPEPTYRPFVNAKECWQEMQNHLPFGWVKTIHDEDPEVFIHCEVITKIDGVLTSIDEVPFSYDNMYRTYTFADGTPFGIREEQQQNK